MAELLFKLTHVPVDEALQVRQLLQSQDIDYYETDAGTWGVGIAAIWLPDNQQLEQAKKLIEQYQRERCEAAQAEPCQHSLWDSFLRAPLRFILAISFVTAILYLSIAPFFAN